MLGNLSWWFRLGGKNTNSEKEQAPGFWAGLKKRKDWEMEPNLRDGISGDIYHTVMGIPTSNKKTESLLSPASLEKSTDYAPNKDHPKHGDKKVLVSVWTTQSVWSEWPTFGHGYSLLLVKCTGNILKIRNVAWNQRNPISKSTLQRILNPACSSGTAIHKRLRLFLSPPWRPAQSGAAQLEPSPQRHPPWNTKMWAIGNIWYTMI